MWPTERVPQRIGQNCVAAVDEYLSWLLGSAGKVLMGVGGCGVVYICKGTSCVCRKLFDISMAWP